MNLEGVVHDLYEAEGSVHDRYRRVVEVNELFVLRVDMFQYE